MDGVKGMQSHTFSCCQAVKLRWCIHTLTKNSVGVCGWWLKVEGVIGKPTHTFFCC